MQVGSRLPQFLVVKGVSDHPIFGRRRCSRAVAICGPARVKLVVIPFMIVAAQSIGTALGDGN
jgi:hypothetical protein